MSGIVDVTAGSEERLTFLQKLYVRNVTSRS